MQYIVDSEYDTLVATVVSTVTFSRTDSHSFEQLEVINVDGASEIYFIIADGLDNPTNPTVAGDDTRVIPAVRGQSYKMPLRGGSKAVTVELISAGTPAFGVIAELV